MAKIQTKTEALMRFKEFLQEAIVDCPQGIFAKVLLTTDSTNALTAFFANLPLVDDLHATLIYSKTPAKQADLPNIDKATRYKAKATELLHWPGHDNEGYIVLKLESEELHDAHQLFRNAGLTPTFPDYKPHITLVHPVPNFQSHQASFDHYNMILRAKPLELDMYYGGYVIQEETLV